MASLSWMRWLRRRKAYDAKGDKPGLTIFRAAEPPPDQARPTFAIIASLNAWVQAGGGSYMGTVELLRNRAEEYLEKARAISDRQRARLLVLQAHNYLKRAEETEAEQLSARR